MLEVLIFGTWYMVHYRIILWRYECIAYLTKQDKVKDAVSKGNKCSHTGAFCSVKKVTSGVSNSEEIDEDSLAKCKHT